MSGSVMQLLELILRLRQAACHGRLLPGIHEAHSSKVDILLERLEEIREGGLHALVFSQWTGFLDLIEAPLRAKGHAVLRIDGATKNRQEIVDAFQSATQPSVLLMSLKAGGVGLNLTAADHVFIMDPWWNPAAERQAADRAHRIGRTRPVFVHKFIARQTIEEAILALQERKANLAESLLDGQDSAGALTKDDLMALLETATL
jgi:SNF2 family DNA or RNA helicase